MSNSSTTDVSAPNLSSNNLVTVSHCAIALVASLTRAYSGDYSFTISERKLDRQNSPELTQVQKLVEEIPQIEFQTVSEIGHHLQHYCSTVGEYRCHQSQKFAFIKNQPEPKQFQELKTILLWVHEQKNNFGAGGEQSLVSYENLVEQLHNQTEEEANRIQMKIRAIYILRDKTEYWQGFWDAIADHLLPDASIAAGTPGEALAALALWIGGLIASGFIYHKSWGREKLLEVLQTWEDQLKEEYNMILVTRDELTKYIKGITELESLWTRVTQKVWILFRPNVSGDHRNTIIRYNAHMKDLEVVEGMISQANEPFKVSVVKMYPYHGPGISVHRNAKEFCKNIPHALESLQKLLTAKGIIHSSKQEEYAEKVYCLAELIYGHLEHIQQLCTPWSNSIDPKELAVFLEEQTWDFLIKTDRVIQAIKQMLKTKVRDGKAAGVLRTRIEWDRRFKNRNWKNRPLVSATGALNVLDSLANTINVIYRFSVCTGTGTNMSAMEGIVEAQRSYPEFNHSNPLLQDFFKVLRGEIRQGSLAFPRRDKETIETKSSSGGWRRWFKGQKQKPEVLIFGS